MFDLRGIIDHVNDALVVGVPDEKWGQAVTAVVELAGGANVGEAELRTHVRERGRFR